MTAPIALSDLPFIASICRPLASSKVCQSSPSTSWRRDFRQTDVSAFAPLSSLRMNRFREEVYRGFKECGYSLVSYISSKATYFPTTTFGDNCFVLENATVQPFSSIGNNVVLWSGCHVGHHSTVGDHAFFAPHAVTAGHCMVGPYCFLGTNATVRDHITLGEGTLVGMGAIIARDTEPWTVYKAAATTCHEEFECG